ncbi:unnamed protein product [Microthlaspi erraticum]|uniref:Uncharacterized protein n=1 Tax=Microthlaspi erraticum TaxID=1685480 RepID=A0A6D2KAN8_9BRAS|nr:unnamed protein product [Microthlaspi erraticum]
MGKGKLKLALISDAKARRITIRLTPVDLKDLGSLIDKYLEDVNRRIEVLEDSRGEIGESYAAGGPSEGLGSAPAATIDEDDSSSSSTTAAARMFH